MENEKSAPKLKIEAGKFYRTRDGGRAGPMRTPEYAGRMGADFLVYPFSGAIEDGAVLLATQTWTRCGHVVRGQKHGQDLVAEWFTLKPGSYYRLRDGTEAGPLVRDGSEPYVFRAQRPVLSNHGQRAWFTFKPDGSFSGADEHHWDIVGEIPKPFAIEAGSWYVTRCGDVVGPLEPCAALHVNGGRFQGLNHRIHQKMKFTADFGAHCPGVESSYDLVRYATDQEIAEAKGDPAAVPAPLVIAEQRWYVARDGHVIGPMKRDAKDPGSYPFIGFDHTDQRSRSFREDGYWSAPTSRVRFDLVRIATLDEIMAAVLPKIREEVMRCAAIEGVPLIVIASSGHSLSKEVFSTIISRVSSAQTNVHITREIPPCKVLAEPRPLNLRRGVRCRLRNGLTTGPLGVVRGLDPMKFIAHVDFAFERWDENGNHLTKTGVSTRGWRHPFDIVAVIADSPAIEKDRLAA